MISKNVSHLSAKLLARLHEKSKKCFSIKDAAAILAESSAKDLSALLVKMAREGLLMQIKKGLYYIIPYEQDPESFMPDWHLLAQYLVGDAKFYIGYYSAMQLHSLITQPALKEQIVVDRQIKPSILKIKNIPFQFIYHNKSHFFGNKPIWVDSFNKVQCSDLEKTFLDALFKPEYAGGITEIAKAIYKSRDKINFTKLEEYAKAFGSLAVSKRLGFLLELLELNQKTAKELQALSTKSYFLLDPSGPKEGRRISHWNLQQNIDNQSILSPLFS